jgi:hypothetical protein
MKKAVFALILFLIGCSSNKPRTFVVQGMTEGLKRDWGHEFYTIDVYTELPAGHWEKYYWSRDLYFQKEKIDEASSADISPSGRFAVYESRIHGGIILFDVKNHKKYQVVKGTVPTVEEWGKDEESFVLRYYLTGNETRTIRINISELKLLKE